MVEVQGRGILALGTDRHDDGGCHADAPNKGLSRREAVGSCPWFSRSGAEGEPVIRWTVECSTDVLPGQDSITHLIAFIPLNE